VVGRVSRRCSAARGWRRRGPRARRPFPRYATERDSAALDRTRPAHTNVTSICAPHWLTPAGPQGPAAPAAKLTPNAGGLGVSAALPRWLALHRVDRRSRAQACAPPCRHRQPVHGQPPADRARACDIDARPQCSSLRGGTHQAPAASGKARAAQGSNALRTSCDVKWRYSRDEREHMFSVALDESRANTLDRRQLVRRARS
jgi:hypothetical protein